MKKEIIEIEYPIQNSKIDYQKFIVGDSCKAIKIIVESGEMAGINFYEVELNDGTFLEIRASEVIARYRKTEDEIAF